LRVYGLDFTCSPNSGKALTLAVCDFNGKVLSVDRLHPLKVPKKTPFGSFDAWLREPGPWIAGLDFPFGMPLAAIKYFTWLKGVPKADWTAYIGAIEKQYPTRKEFKNLIESWRDPERHRSGGEASFVRHFRQTDLTNGADAQSPMNCVNPALGQMFFEGCIRLAKADVSIEPVRRLPNADRVVVEAYPKLVARRWLFSQQGYKSDKKKPPAQTLEMRYARCDVISAIRGMAKNDCRPSMESQFGFRVEMKGADVTACLSDGTGDKLDSVLCAVQAAWAWTKRGENYGMRADCDLLEGWIVDPLLATAPNEGGDDEPC
jgi:hypothetical protein